MSSMICTTMLPVSRVNLVELIINTGTLTEPNTPLRALRPNFQDILEGSTIGTLSETSHHHRPSELRIKLISESSPDSQSSVNGKSIGVKVITCPLDTTSSRISMTDTFLITHSISTTVRSSLRTTLSTSFFPRALQTSRSTFPSKSTQWRPLLTSPP